MTEFKWKTNWEETREHFDDWWNQDGLVVGAWSPMIQDGLQHERVTQPPPPKSIRDQYADPVARARRNHAALSRCAYPLDVLPMYDNNTGPGSLALFIGSEPEFAEDTVWFTANLEDEEDPESLPPLVFNPESEWWKITEAHLRASVELGEGKYLTGCPDLIENVDILSALRGPETFMMDMIEYPEWVQKSIREINQVWFEAYQRIYDIIQLEDGSSAFTAFSIWGPGKTAKVQCDACSMFSPEMFRRFVMPSLSEQCDWLDHSLYHLDGTHCIAHLDALLEIESLGAIEWTPEPKVPKGGDPCWHDMYRRILEAGKSVQVLHPTIDEVEPLLNALGTRGVYMLMQLNTEEEVDAVERILKRYR